jgi:hypothetical protein
MFGSAQLTPVLSVRLQIQGSPPRLQYVPELFEVVDCLKDTLENSHRHVLNSDALLALVQLLQPLSESGSAPTHTPLCTVPISP